MGKFETKKETCSNKVQSNFVFFKQPQLTLTVVQSAHPHSLGGSDWNNSIITQLDGGPEKMNLQCWLAILAAHQAFRLHIHIMMVAFEGYI